MDSIVFYGTAAGAMAALAPSTAVIKYDGFIVGYSSLSGSDNNMCTLTCPGDSRWEAAGFRLQPGNADAAQAGAHYVPYWLPTKVPIKEGTTLVATQDGADDFYVCVYVSYPGQGPDFKVRHPAVDQPEAFEVFKTITAGGAVTAFTISTNSTSDATFQRGKDYTPVGVKNAGVMTTPFFVGIQSTKRSFTTFWLVPLTPLVAGTPNLIMLPYGLDVVSGGETAFYSFLSTTAETPAAEINYAYRA